MNNFFKTIRYLIEAFIVKFALWCFYAIGYKRASDMASKLARMIGKIHPTHKLAYQNLSKSFPQLSTKEKEKILDDMWDNLGRIVGEYVHLARLDANEMVKKYVITNEETKKNIAMLKQSKQGGIIFSGHIGNWEAGPKALMAHGLDVHTVYRPLNNPYVEEMTASIRGSKLIPKGVQGTKQIIEALRKGEYVIILMDQKISEGEPVPFFFDDATTATSIARIALRYNVPLIPARVIRIDHEFKFMVDVERPLDFSRSGDLNSDIFNLTLQINQKLEKWITEFPAQWFWVHNRWKK